MAMPRVIWNNKQRIAKLVTEVFSTVCLAAYPSVYKFLGTHKDITFSLLWKNENNLVHFEEKTY